MTIIKSRAFHQSLMYAKGCRKKPIASIFITASDTNKKFMTYDIRSKVLLKEVFESRSE